MKFISWNVNGIRAVMTKNFEEIFKNLDADVFCLQETKVQAGQIEVNFEDTINSGTTPRKKAIRERQCSPKERL